MSIAKLSLTSRQLTGLIITSPFEYWAETDGKGLVFGVKNVATPSVYRHAMTAAVANRRRHRTYCLESLPAPLQAFQGLQQLAQFASLL